MTKLIKPYNTGLCPENAYWMAKIAHLVYKIKPTSDSFPDEEGILAELKKEDVKFKSVVGFDKSSAQGAMIEHEDYLCMAFRGTDEILDWIDNINAFSKQEMFGHFHTGFYNSLEDIWSDINKSYEKLLQDKKRPIFITGHSLGGAMAAIAAAKFIHKDKPFTSVYTFGQPRAMTRETCRLFNAECKGRFFRFQNNNDIVTRIPARIMGYSHVGECLYISEEKEIHKDVGFWFKFLDSVDGVMENIKEKGMDCVKDHDMADYLSAIKAWDMKD